MKCSLLYLTTSRYYILFNTCLCARLQSDSRKYHLAAVNIIFKYLKGNTNLVLFYEKLIDYKLGGFF